MGGERVGEEEEGYREGVGGGGGGRSVNLRVVSTDEPVGDPAPWEPDEGYEGDGIRGEPRYRLSTVMMLARGWVAEQNRGDKGLQAASPITIVIEAHPWRDDEVVWSESIETRAANQAA